MTLDRYYPESHKRFLSDVGPQPAHAPGDNHDGHQLAVLHDDGLYRHLRFQRPNTGMYWFDIITWPGVLTISSDMGHYMFSRVKDMFEFFTASDYINPSYWSEKVTAQDVHSPIKRFSEDKFKARVIEYYSERTRSIPEWAQAELFEAITQLITDEECGDEHTAHGALARFSFEAVKPGSWSSPANAYLPSEVVTFRFTDTWDWELTDYSTQFLWCCHAIQWGIEQYRKTRVATVVLP